LHGFDRRRVFPARSLDAPAIGDLAASRGIAVHALIPRSASLEDAYLDLTGESVEYRGHPASPGGTPSR
jgi:ABC-2 type transport system ATP-binding protein